MTIRDQVGNERIENPANIGLKVYLNNPLEDLVAPRYIEKSMSLSVVEDKFLQGGWGGLAQDECGACADTIAAEQAIRMSFKMEEKNVMQGGMGALIQMIMPTKPGLTSKSIAFQKTTFTNDFTDSTKEFLAYRVIEDYQPTGYYVIADGNMYDKAGNSRGLTFDLDKNNLNYELNEGKGQRSLRDSVYIKTAYPDDLPPILDLNNIKVKATPTNPTNPNGETNVELWTRIKDTSAYTQHAAGLMFGEFCLRDPQGLQHWYSMQISSSVKAVKSINNVEIDSSRLSIYRDYYVKVLLPVGSAPGTWGVQEIRIGDNADNRKNYDFTQLVRFDLDTSTILRIDPYVEILGKKVNAKNVDSVGIKFGCKNCEGQNYRITIYSSMGGNSVTLQGAMTADTLSLNNLKLGGVNDGIIYATVFILDSTASMIGNGRASYTKDVLLPRPANVLANLANLGKSNLDSLVVDMKVSELNGGFNIVVVQGTISKPLAFSFHDDNVKPFGINPDNPSVGDTVIISGKVTDSVFKITNLPLSQFQDGLIELQISFVDSVGNPSTPVKSYFYKDTKDPLASITKLSNTDLKAVYSIQSNEYLSNELTAENLRIETGAIDSLKKISNRLYHLYITRVCNDSVAITLKANALLDTIGNKNVAASTQFLDLVKPTIPIISFSKPLTFCLGDSSVLSVAAGSNYQWYKDGVAINGSTAGSIKVSDSGNYSDTVLNALGCKAGSALSNVVVKALPAKPTVSWNGSDLSTTSTATLQWVLNSAAITGATSATYKPLAIGFYKIEAINTDGCKITSDSFNLVVTTINNARSATVSTMAKLVPNPAASFLLVTFSEAPENTLDIQLLTNNGQAIKSVKTKNKVTSIPVGELPAGNYFIKIIGNKYDQTQGVIIAR
jgi:hypothetical protein